MSTCPQCGTTYPPHVSICPLDGTVLQGQDSGSRVALGTVIAGKYRIDGVLGRGGMGAVYRATHVMLNKTVALKTINPDLVGSTEMVQRFQREARAATSLEHPNIVSVYDLGQSEDGALYIAMEFVDGQNLKDVIRESGPMQAARIVHLLSQVASALSRAHRNHIVHRDLKPQNLVISTDANGREVVKLLDFGIAKTLEEGATALTAAGYALGTPHYIAPEQALGQAIDGRADLYSLGVILYEMLAGDVPFTAASAPAILVKHLNDVPEPPSQRRPDLHIPPALEAVALRCLEKDPAKRFQTADEFATALERSVPAGVPVDPVGPASATVVLPPNAGAPPIEGDAVSAAHAIGPPAPPPPAMPSGVPPPVPAPAAGALPPLPPPLPPTTPATRPTLRTPDAAVAPAVTPASGGSNRGRSVAIVVVLAVAALLLVATVLGSYAVYRAWTLRSQRVPDRASEEPAPASTPAMAADATAPGATEKGAGRDMPTPGAPPPQAAPSEAATSSDPGPRAGAPAASPAARQPEAAVAEPPRARSRAATPAPAAPIAVPPQQPAASAPPALPRDPPVYLECAGAPDVCSAFTAAFDQVLEREGLPRAGRPDGAEVIVDARATLLETRDDTQFGATFTVQTFSLELRAESTRDGASIGMPAAKTFSFDRRFGRERAAEQSRLMAGDAVERIRRFWSKHAGE